MSNASVHNYTTDSPPPPSRLSPPVFTRSDLGGFGFEPEIVAKVAQLHLRIYEVGISYHGRTYDEGKKIGYKDGFRALYCIFRYNAPKTPIPIQLMLYLFIVGTAAVVIFLILELYLLFLNILKLLGF